MTVYPTPTDCHFVNPLIRSSGYGPVTCYDSILLGAFVTERWRARPQTSLSGWQFHLIHLTILRRFSWPNLAYYYVHNGGLKPHSFHFILLTTVNSNPHLKLFTGHVRYRKCLGGSQNVQRHSADLDAVFFAITTGQSADHHIHTTYGLHLVHIVLLYAAVHEIVQIVEKLHNLAKTRRREL